MARAATGTVVWRPGKNGVEGWHARLSLNGERPWIALPGIPQDAEELARQEAARVSVRMREGKYVKACCTETLGEYAERWLASRERKGLRTARSDRGRLTKWILPHLGTKPIAEIDKQDIKMVVRALDEAVLDGRLRWKTALNTFGCLTKLFDDACEAKESELVVRQLSGAYRVKHPGLIPLHAQAKALLRKFGRTDVQHVRREQNKAADAVVNQVLDANR